uniref:Spaetzle domain-containing protein n=1 Tax=Rhodnius prolixus TaxID=13249 RepID=T1HKQ9_RHOPR
MVRSYKIKEFEYKSLCHKNEFNVTLSEDGDDYEYLPKTYLNIECYTPDAYINSHTQMCDFPGYRCIKKKRIVPIFRRLNAKWRGSWEFVREEIQGYGCECMYPQKLN